MSVASTILAMADRFPRSVGFAMARAGPLLARRGPPHWLVRQLLARTFTRVPVNVNGLLVPWGEDLEERLRSGVEYEPETRAVIRSLLKEGMTVIDAGAHVGSVTTLAADRVGPTGHVHSFEADPEIASLLRKNVARFANVTVNAVALGDQEGSATFYSGSDAAIGSLKPPRSDLYKCRRIIVPQMKLSTYLDRARVKSVNMIKIDVEGAELSVLRSIAALLKTQRPAIVIELARQRQEAFGSSTSELCGFLRDCGYDLKVIGACLTPLDETSLPDICNVLAS